MVRNCNRQKPVIIIRTRHSLVQTPVCLQTPQTPPNSGYDRKSKPTELCGTRNVGCFFVQLRLQPKLNLFLQAMPAFKINCHLNKSGKNLVSASWFQQARFRQARFWQTQPPQPAQSNACLGCIYSCRLFLLMVRNCSRQKPVIIIHTRHSLVQTPVCLQTAPNSGYDQKSKPTELCGTRNVGCFFVQLRLESKLNLFLQAMPAFKINCHLNKSGKNLVSASWFQQARHNNYVMSGF